MVRQEMKAAGDDLFDSILSKIAALWRPEEKL